MTEPEAGGGKNRPDAGAPLDVPKHGLFDLPARGPAEPPGPGRVEVHRLAWIGVAVVAIVLVGLALVAKKTPTESILAAPSASAPPPAPERPGPANATAAEAELLRDLDGVDPSDLYAKANLRALAWDRNAQLLSLMARPVVGGKVKLSSQEGEIAYTFRGPRRVAPTGRPEPADQYTVTFNAKAVSTSAENSGSAAGPGRLDEPTCVFREAMKMAIASGVANEIPLEVRYEMDRTQQRGVWRVGDDRILDGRTCAIVTQR